MSLTEGRGGKHWALGFPRPVLQGSSAVKNWLPPGSLQETFSGSRRKGVVSLHLLTSFHLRVQKRKRRWTPSTEKRKLVWGWGGTSQVLSLGGRRVQKQLLPNKQWGHKGNQQRSNYKLHYDSPTCFPRPKTSGIFHGMPRAQTEIWVSIL